MKQFKDKHIDLHPDYLTEKINKLIRNLENIRNIETKNYSHLKGEVEGNLRDILDYIYLFFDKLKEPKDLTESKYIEISKRIKRK